MKGSDVFTHTKSRTLLDRSKLVCTRDDLAKLKNFLNEAHVIEFCGQEKNEHKVEVLQVDKYNSICCLNQRRTYGVQKGVLPKPLLKNCTISFLMFEENTRQACNDNLCPFCALDLLLPGNLRLDKETSKIFYMFMSWVDRRSPSQFHGVHMNDIPIVESVLLLKILLYDIDFVEGNIIGELTWRSVQKDKNTVRLLRYNNHICCLRNINAVFQFFCYPNSDIFFNRTPKFGSTFEYMQWSIKKCLSEERISSPRISLWQAGLFWY